MQARAGIRADDTLLVVGAGGGCGVAAVQLAKHVGARVVAVTGSEDKCERLRDLGADVTLSYRDSDWPQQVRAATGGRGVSAAFDNGGADTLPLTIRCLDQCARLFSAGGTTGMRVALDLPALYRQHVDLHFYMNGTRADMVELVAMVARGDLDPVVDSVFPVADAAAADERLMASEQFGRIVLSPQRARTMLPA